MKWDVSAKLCTIPAVFLQVPSVCPTNRNIWGSVQGIYNLHCLEGRATQEQWSQVLVTVPSHWDQFLASNNQLNSCTWWTKFYFKFCRGVGSCLHYPPLPYTDCEESSTILLEIFTWGKLLYGFICKSFTCFWVRMYLLTSEGECSVFCIFYCKWIRQIIHTGCFGDCFKFVCTWPALPCSFNRNPGLD